jgi:hypothetical protein
VITIKAQRHELEELARKVGIRGPMVLEWLISKSDHAPPEEVEVVQPPIVPNALGTYGNRDKTVQAQANAAVEGADAPETVYNGDGSPVVTTEG